MSSDQSESALLSSGQQSDHDTLDINQSINQSHNSEQQSLIEDDDINQSINQSSKAICEADGDPINQSTSDSKFNLFTVMVAGAGFACDSYDLFIMNAILVVMGCSISDPADPLLKSVCHLTPSAESKLATAVLVGSMLGQLTFGTIADRIGRRKAFIATLSLLIIGATLSSAAVNWTPELDWITILAVSRFILGVGVGGEYPLSATVSSEASTITEGRGKRVAAVFSMQSVGILLAPVVVLILLASVDDFELVWRLALGIGALPGLVMLYWRFTMKETAVYQAAADARSNHPSVDRWRLIKTQWRDLLGTAGNWWLFDIVFYANSFFSSKVTSAFLPILTQESDHEAKHDYLVAVGWSLGILAIFGMPGYIVGTLLVDRWGRRKLQLFGYVGMAVSYLLMSLIDTDWLRANRSMFYLIYGASFFFCNCGPNVTTFVIPSEIFHTDIRSTCHGISACAGKFGAAIGAALYPFIYAASDESIRPAMWLSTGISIAGFGFTWIITRESRDLDLTHPSIDQSNQHQPLDEERPVIEQSTD